MSSQNTHRIQNVISVDDNLRILYRKKRHTGIGEAARSQCLHLLLVSVYEDAAGAEHFMNVSQVAADGSAAIIPMTGSFSCA